MKQRVQLFFTFFAILAICIISGAVMAAEAGLSRGAAYLESTQSPSGWWNGDESRRPVDTMEALLALLHAGGDQKAMGRAIGYLASLGADDNESLSLRLRALSHSTEDTTETARELTSRQMPDGGWGLEGTRLGAVPDTALAVLALVQSGKASPNSLSSAGNFLLKAQSADGSWRFTEERSLSDTAHTAMVLEALLSLRGAGYVSGTQAETAVERAAAWLEGTGCLAGGGSLLDTAWCYLALAGIRQPAELQAALARIEEAQLDDGSWNGLVYDTAVCLRAMAAVRPPDDPLPDLSVSEASIAFSPASPLSGESVRISATIFNEGTAASPSCPVSFHNRDPRLGGEEIAPAAMLPSIQPGGSAVVSADFSTAGLAGRQQIVVFIDRQGTVAEASRANNAAARLLNIGGLPDLSVSASGMTLSPARPSAFETAELSVTVRNLGNGEARNVPVRIDDGERTLVSQTLSSIAPGGSFRFIVSTAFAAGEHSVTAFADPGHVLIDEQVLSNNSATLSFSVPEPPAAPPDISVSALTCEPSSPVAGEVCTATATVDNRGGTDASSFDVVLRLDGVVAGTITVPGIHAGGRAILEFTGLVLAAGDHILRVEADAAQAVSGDANRADNSRETGIHAADMDSPAELELLSLEAVPGTSDAGLPVAFTAVVRNNGAKASPSVPLRFMVDGEAVGDDLLLAAVPGGGVSEATFLHSFNAGRVFGVSVKADPDEAVPDADRDNNVKSLEYHVSGANALSVSASDISLPRDPPAAFAEFTVSAVIRNGGTLDASGVPVRFLDNGVEMATMTLGLVPAGGSAHALLTTALPAGDHDITVSVDPDRILPDEHDYSDNSCTCSVAVHPVPSAPLALAAEVPRLVPASPKAGEQVSICASVANRGGTDADPFTVELRDGTSVLAYFDVPRLPAGGRADFEVLAALSAGIHDISIAADPAGTTGDSDTSDNSATLRVDVPDGATPPNLLVVAVAVSPSAPSAGDQAVFTVSVKNAGTEAAGPFAVSLALEEEAIASWRVSGLEGGGTVTLQSPRHGLAGTGLLHAAATADAEGEVAETDETDNSSFLEISVSDTPKPDLTLPSDGVALSPAIPQPGVPFTAAVTVANGGTETSPGCRLEAMSPDGVKALAAADIPPITPGGTAAVPVLVTLDEGDAGFMLVADSGNDVAERDESNNSLSVAVSPVSLPDLLVEPQGISFSHTDLSRGTTVAIRVLVSNAGTAASPSGTLDVSRTASGASAAIGSAALPPLAPGASCEVAVLWNAVPGSSSIAASAVLPENVAEAERGNNTAVREAAFTGVLPASVRLLDVPEDDSPGTPREAFVAYEDMEIEVTHHWGADCKPYLFVLDSAGGVYSVTRYDGRYYWNTGNAAPGDYRVRLTILSAETAVEVINGVATSVGILLEESFLPFRIEESGDVRVLRLRASPAFSMSGEACVLKTSAELLSQSNTDRELEATLRLKSPSGETLATRSATIAAGRRDSRLVVDFARLELTSGAPGTYKLELEVSENGVAVAADVLDFPVLGTNAGIRAVRRVEPESISPGGPRRVRVTVEIEGVDDVRSGE